MAEEESQSRLELAAPIMRVKEQLEADNTDNAKKTVSEILENLLPAEPEDDEDVVEEEDEENNG